MISGRGSRGWGDIEGVEWGGEAGVNRGKCRRRIGRARDT